MTGKQSDWHGLWQAANEGWEIFANIAKISYESHFIDSLLEVMKVFIRYNNLTSDIGVQHDNTDFEN